MGRVACHRHGSYSVQALLSSLHTPEETQLICDGLYDQVVKLISHASGHFVILRILRTFSFPQTKFVYDAIQKQCVAICTCHYGLRVMKHLIAHHMNDSNSVSNTTNNNNNDIITNGDINGGDSNKTYVLHRIIKQITRHALKLVENQYGNYVVQSVLDHAPSTVRSNLMAKLEGVLCVCVCVCVCL